RLAGAFDVGVFEARAHAKHPFRDGAKRVHSNKLVVHNSSLQNESIAPRRKNRQRARVRAMKAKALAHVSIATPDAEATAREYATLLGATIRSRETLDDRGLHVVFLDCAGIPIELIQPVDPDSKTNTVAKFLKTRGPGLHH